MLNLKNFYEIGQNLILNLNRKFNFFFYLITDTSKFRQIIK